ncbi:MAG: YtxH domain-containing protein [Bacteroidia bacterium]|nr:YtxH domain-containing protein [Bacteroidia bacterium]MBT8276054.1 YtxH domain-containing protein [Bacteroidia bacterium]NNF29966.1 YtxH domain-containing protein [Flavobacteriaceae bacterium]NNK53671.1 YtxH domain-containing protein [Flavobacteriaceae bacterium]NNM09308.1 YtxH domain-containing protein [Flavobacteriaceae bacterium]
MKKGRLLALLGLAGGAFAYWKYKNLSPEQKEELKQKARKVGKDVKEATLDAEQTISEGLDKLSDKAKEVFDKATT